MEVVEIKDVTKRRKQPRVLTYRRVLGPLKFVDEPVSHDGSRGAMFGPAISEVMALQWSDVDFANLTVRVQRGIVHGHVDVVKTEYSNDDFSTRCRSLRDLAILEAAMSGNPEWMGVPEPNTLKPYWQESICADHIKPAAW